MQSEKLKLINSCLVYAHRSLTVLTNSVIYEDNINVSFSMIGMAYVQNKRFKSLHYSINKILQSCLNGINNAVPKDWDILDDGVYCPYNEILWEINKGDSNSFIINLEPDIRNTMSKLPSFNKRFNEGFEKFFGGIHYCRENEDGEMIKLNPIESEERLDDEYYQDLETSSQEITWADDLKRVKEIAEQKGSLHEILSLL